VLVDVVTSVDAVKLKPKGREDALEIGESHGGARLDEARVEFFELGHFSSTVGGLPRFIKAAGHVFSLLMYDHNNSLCLLPGQEPSTNFLR